MKVEEKWELSDRGFKYLEHIEGLNDDQIRVFESSNAQRPCIWINITESLPNTESVNAHIQLPIEDAKRLANQLMTLVKNHYQLEGQ